MALTMLEPHEIVRFAEGLSDLEPDIEAEILTQVVSSPDLRKRIAALRRDLYLVECQIPDYQMAPEYLIELNKLAEIWVRMRMERKLKLQKFLFGREFAALGLLLAGLVGLALAILSYL